MRLHSAFHEPASFSQVLTIILTTIHDRIQFTVRIKSGYCALHVCLSQSEQLYEVNTIIISTLQGTQLELREDEAL